MPLLYSKMRSITSCFPNNIRKKEIKTCTRPPKPTHDRTSPHPFPALLPAIALNASPGAGVKAGPEPAKGHPEGLALTPARTAPHSSKPGAGQDREDHTATLKKPGAG